MAKGFAEEVTKKRTCDWLNNIFNLEFYNFIYLLPY